MAERILVTGAAGFIYSHVAEHLADQGHEVYGIDNLSIGRIGNVPNNIKFETVDMRDKDKVHDVVRDFRPTIIHHGAAWAHEGLSQFMPMLITENNYNAYLNLVVPAIRYGVRRIVMASSMSVYGAQTPPFNEDMERAPEDIYAIAKTSMEKATEVLADVHGFEYTIIRPHNVYGPRQIIWDPYRNVVGIFVNRIMRGQPPVVYGDGQQTRSFSYIDDVAPYIAKAGFIDEAKGEIINVGPLEEYTINRLADVVIDAFGVDMEPRHEADRPREVKHAYCTNDKARRILGYHTSVTLEEGVGKMVEWAKTIGPQEFQYLEGLELEGDKVPRMWSKKLM